MFENLIYNIITNYGYIGIFILMIFQTIFVVIPSEAVIALSGALGLDATRVIAIGVLGLLTGAIIAFFISRYFGRKIVIKLIGDEWIGEVDEWIDKNGSKAILLARLIPLIPFDLISYVAGITKIDFRKYILATTIGMIPRTIFLVYAGTVTKDILSLIGLGVDFILISGIIAIFMIIYLDKKGKLNKIRKIMLKRAIGKK